MRLHILRKYVIALLMCLAPLAASADVIKVVIDDTIQPLSQERIERAIQEAQRSHADALLIELRTPGGLMSSMEDIIHKILDSQVPVIIYVTPSGSGAASAVTTEPRASTRQVPPSGSPKTRTSSGPSGPSRTRRMPPKPRCTEESVATAPIV